MPIPASEPLWVPGHAKLRKAPLWLILAVLAAIVAALSMVGTALAFAATSESLGQIVFEVGQGSGADANHYGYDSGATFGTLDAGSFPGDLFGDGNSRTVDEIYEDEDGYWYLTYSGGLADDWLDDQEALDEITIEVAYEDETNFRSFVLGGFIDSRPDTRGLKLDPPILDRDWEARDGQDVTIDFRRHRTQAIIIAPPSSPPLTEPAGEPGSFVEFLSLTTPGGPVMAQTLIVILVYSMFLFTAPSTPWGTTLSALVLIMTPWVPVMFGYGSTISGAIILVNVAAGAFAYKVFAARTES